MKYKYAKIVICIYALIPALALYVDLFVADGGWIGGDGWFATYFSAFPLWYGKYLYTGESIQANSILFLFVTMAYHFLVIVILYWIASAIEKKVKNNV